MGSGMGLTGPNTFSGGGDDDKDIPPSVVFPDLRCEIYSVNDVNTVSYTHLDVYKRQLQTCCSLQFILQTAVD